jgi:alkylation response protein AidB-like acyl-CoA dehydrogenase
VPPADFDDSPEEAGYRVRVRGLLEEHAGELLHLQPGQEGVDARRQEAELRRTQRVLADAGLVDHIGIGMCGPTVITHGSQDQRDRYLARLLRADDAWCQLFSEPASGSDLAALRTTAVTGNPVPCPGSVSRGGSHAASFVHTRHWGRTTVWTPRSR